MLEIGKSILDNNLFISKTSTIGSDYVVNRIIDNYDLEGYNLLFLTGSFRNSNLRFNCSTIKYLSYEEIPKLLEDNLFRVEIIIVKLFKNYSIILESIRKITDLPIIIIGERLDDFYKLDDFKYVYTMHREKKESSTFIGNIFDVDEYEVDFLNSSFITDVKNNWEVSLNNLQKEYIRNNKIDLILKNEKKK